MFRRKLLSIFILLAAPAFTSAADAPAATSQPAPAAAASSRPVRLSPKDVSKAFIQALCDGDMNRARSYLLPWSRTDEMLEGRGAYYQSWGAFEAACAKAFGGPTTQPGKPSSLADEHFKAIDAA